MTHGPKPKLIIWGASGHATVVADIVRQVGEYQIAGFLDNVNPERQGEVFAGYPILGGADQLSVLMGSGVAWAIIAIGDGKARRQLAVSAVAAGFKLAKAIHPTAILAPDAQIGAGTVIAAGAIINPGARIADNVIINTGAIVEHDCVIGPGAHLCPGTRIAGTVQIGAGVWLGIGATVIDKITIGPESVVGAGAVVVDHIPAGVVAYGVPARVQRNAS